MTFRLTTLSNFILFRNSLAQRNSDMFKYSEQLSSMKRINRPSDDPEGTRMVLSSREALSKLEQYGRALNDADVYLQNGESTVSQVKDILVRAKEIAISGNTPTMSLDARTNLAQEVQQLMQHLQELSNSQVNDEYLFSGNSTQTKPFALAVNQPPYPNPAATYAGATTFRAVQVSDNAQIAYQINGERLFKGESGGVDQSGYIDLFQTLGKLEMALTTEPRAADTDPDSIGQAIEDLDVGIKQVLNEIADIGAKQNRITALQTQQTAQGDTIKEFLTTTEDADIGEVVYNFQRANIALQAAVQSSGSILNLPSLMEFIGK